MSESLFLRALLPGLLMVICLAASVRAADGVYPRIEAAFDLPQVTGNPFDYTQNDVQVTLAGPDGATVTLPAFFDGDTTWRVRHTPATTGQFTVRSVTLNGQDADPQNLTPSEFTVTGQPELGFVRIDPKNQMKFMLDDGSRYYPVGYNLAWRHMGQPPMPPLVESFDRMEQAGVNWTRIWMNHWDSKNLDWLEDKTRQPELGQLSLEVARSWDDIVQAAETNDVFFQMVLQHHGQYSTRADANWQINPWNVENGGWLASPVDFFTDPKARELTKQKYRYIIARWGYSPSIMAWELFNEVEYTNAFQENLQAVADWHQEMAAFLREQDVYDHLVTTSSRVTEPSLWPAMDYYQSHIYPPDILVAIQTLEAHDLDRPYFYGEFGGAAFGPQADPAGDVHTGLWGSLMSQSSGAAQYWFWYIVEPEGLLTHYTAVQNFIRESGLLAHDNLQPLDISADTGQRTALTFGPGTGWAPSLGTDFAIAPSGHIAGIGGMSAYLQGEANRAMFPYAQFSVNYTEPGTFAVHVDQTTPDGATLEIALDGRPATTVRFGAAPPQRSGPDGEERPRRDQRLDATIQIPVPAGEHTLRLTNTGPDWIHIRALTLDPYAPELGVLAKGNDDLTVAWIYRRNTDTPDPITGQLTLPSLPDGTYEAVWFDTRAGTIIKQEPLTITGHQPATLTTPPIAQDIALWVHREGE